MSFSKDKWTITKHLLFKCKNIFVLCNKQPQILKPTKNFSSKSPIKPNQNPIMLINRNPCMLIQWMKVSRKSFPAAIIKKRVSKVKSIAEDIFIYPQNFSFSTASIHPKVSAKGKSENFPFPKRKEDKLVLLAIDILTST